LELSWSDFLNPEGGDYSYMYNIPLATAGSDGGPIGDPRWVMTFADPKNLTLVSNAEGAVVTPAMGVYESGTEVTISASEVVGFTFQNWQDTLGNVVSAENPYTFNITSDTYLVAYYEELLSRAITIRLNGTNTATYSLSPAREIYYVGDEVTITVNAHYLNDFLGWSDGSKELSRSFVVANDTTIVANFRQYPYMLAWDFCQLTANNTRFSSLEANHYVNEANKGEMNYVTGDTLAADFQTRNNKFTAEGKELHYSALRRTPAANFDNPDYLFVKFSTLGYTHITVKSAIASDNCVHLVQKMQYSLNGTDYIDFAVDTLPSAEADWNQVWFPLQGTLPKEAQNREEVYVRWIADKTSERVKLASLEEVAYEYLYISQIVILGDDGNGGASWRVKPYDYYLAGDVVEVPGIKLTLGGGTNVWSVSDSVFVFDGVTYISALNGTVNPVDDNNKKFSSSGLPPTVGAFYKFEPFHNGTLKVALVVNANKTSFIIEDNVALPNYNPFSFTEKTYASFDINVTGGKTYYMFSEGSKMGIMGFVYRVPDDLNKAKLTTQIFANNGSLFVKLNKAESIKVYDLLGRTVKSLELREGLNEINGLSRGIYLVRLGSETVKIQL
nr:T9SS type A sorting domain-containing protein [Bacteroidales bacterium]